MGRKSIIPFLFDLGPWVASWEFSYKNSFRVGAAGQWCRRAPESSRAGEGGVAFSRQSFKNVYVFIDC